MEKILPFRVCKTDPYNSVFRSARLHCISSIYIQRQVKKLMKLCTKLTALFFPGTPECKVEKVIFNDTVLIDNINSNKQLKLIPVKCYRN